jgi:hypothetical protein
MFRILSLVLFHLLSFVVPQISSFVILRVPYLIVVMRIEMSGAIGTGHKFLSDGRVPGGNLNVWAAAAGITNPSKWRRSLLRIAIGIRAISKATL